MNILLKSSELLHVFQSLIKNPLSNPVEQEALLNKVKKPLLESLESSEREKTLDSYKDWLEKESQKIKNLSNLIDKK